MLVDVYSVFGVFTIDIFEKNAPLSSANFLAYVDKGLLSNSGVQRIVTPFNDRNELCKINVVQWGISDINKALDPIPHETTLKTGINHEDGTLSLARLEPGSASGIFFICIGDQPELDCGGERYADGEGFAAFGKVVHGMEVVRNIYSFAEEKD